jgi:hypothetical protein
VDKGSNLPFVSCAETPLSDFEVDRIIYSIAQENQLQQQPMMLMTMISMYLKQIRQGK